MYYTMLKMVQNIMSTSTDYIKFVCDQIKGIGDIRYKKMFGEYVVYINDKPILLVCDNTVFVKKLDDISTQMKDSDTDYPYKNAKEHYILDIQNIELTKNVIEILEQITTVPKPRKKSTK